MGMLKKSFAMLMVTVLSVVTFGQTSFAAEGSSDHELNSEDVALAEAIENSVEFDLENEELVITDDSALKEAARDHSSVNYGEIRSGFNHFNAILAGEKGDSTKQELEQLMVGAATEAQGENDGIGTMSTCSNALSILGFGHTTSLATAAVILGVSGPVALAVATGMGLVYTGGQLMCP